MGDYEDSLRNRVERRADILSPDVVAAILKAFQFLREALVAKVIVDLIAGRNPDRVADAVLADDVVTRAFLPLQDVLRSGIVDAGRSFARDTPGSPPPRTVTFAFNILNPDVVTGIRDLETRVITTLQTDVRETVKAFVENGIRDGLNPKQVATELRDVIWMAPHQEAWVSNLRAELEAGDYAAASQRALLDGRYNLEKLASMSASDRAARIETIVSSYRRNNIAFNAETNARTAALDAQKLGQRLSWDDAVERGDVNPDSLMKRWAGVLDSRERPEHVDMEGETVPYDEPFSNGQQIPGDTEFNCRCIPVYFVALNTEQGARIGAGQAIASGAAAAELPTD